MAKKKRTISQIIPKNLENKWICPLLFGSASKKEFCCVGIWFSLTNGMVAQAMADFKASGPTFASFVALANGSAFRIRMYQRCIMVAQAGADFKADFVALAISCRLVLPFPSFLPLT